VAYRGSDPALNDLVGGHVDFMCEQSVSVAESVLAGSVKAYAVSAGERLATLPNVPTAREAGVNYEMSVWAGWQLSWRPASRHAARTLSRNFSTSSLR